MKNAYLDNLNSESTNSTPELVRAMEEAPRMMSYLDSISSASSTTTVPSADTNGLYPVPMVDINTSTASASSSSYLRRPIVAGNWKLNPTSRADAINLLNGLKKEAAQSGSTSNSDVVVFPPLPYLNDALSILKGTGIQVGAQTASRLEKGAYTGEVAPSMLASAGCSHVLLGHSERRTLFGESDEDVNERVLACLKEESLKVVLCVGETLEEYEAGMLRTVVDSQLRKGLDGVSAEELLNDRIVVAYEPVWAIGTGLVATPDQAQVAHVCIRETLRSMYPNMNVDEKVRIQYGGSVSPESVGDLMAQPDVDGALVGGASLLADSFGKIVEGAAPVGTNSASVEEMAALKQEITFSHAPISYFDIDKLTSKGPRNNADVGSPHDSTRPLDKDGNLSSGSWWCAAGGWPSPNHRPTTEFFYVLEGNGCVTDMDDGMRHFFGPGDIVILPKGWNGRWDVLEDIHKVWVVTDHPDVEGFTKPIVEPYSSFGASGSGSRVFLDNGYVSIGSETWEAESFLIPETETSMAFHVLEGIFFITNNDGSARRCVAGDTVLLPKGWSGQVDVIEPVKKLWVQSV